MVGQLVTERPCMGQVACICLPTFTKRGTFGSMGLDRVEKRRFSSRVVDFPQFGYIIAGF